MPVVTTFEKFVEITRKSNLIEEARFNPFYESYMASGGDPNPAPFATKLVREGLLSTFQAKQLLQGRWRRFIINNKYKVLEMLGQGGMGAVYLCEHMMMRRLVALKVLPEDKLSLPGSLERFQREARAVATLDHPNIVHAYDMDRDDNGMHFMVMEYVDGISLELLITKFYKNVGIDPVRAAHYIAQAAMGLQHAFECGWLHRDIKPANLLLDRQGVLKLLDLGLSRLFVGDEEELTRKYDGNTVLGTADYIAPEQALNVSSVDIRADIYGLGATFYFLLAGRPPFDKGTITQKLMYHQTREPDALTQLRPEIPGEMEQVVKMMLAKNPDHRYSTPAAVVEALAPWTQTLIPPPADKEMPPLCPLIRDLLPYSVSGSGRSSGSWSIKQLQAMTTPPLMRTPLSSQSSSAIMMMPQSGAAQGAQRHVDTVVDEHSGSATTPKHMPRFQGELLDDHFSDQPRDANKKKQVLVIAAAAISLLALVIFLIVFIFWWAQQDDDKSNDSKGKSSLNAGRPTQPQITNTNWSEGWEQLTWIRPSDAKQHVQADVVVEMIVATTAKDNQFNLLYSEPTRIAPNQFTVSVTESVLERFYEKLAITQLEQATGRAIQVRGVVNMYNERFPFIRVTDINQIRLVSVIQSKEANQNIGKKVVVEFTIKSTGEATTRVFLNSQASHKATDNFTVVINSQLFNAVLDRLHLNDRSAFEQKTVLIRGKITTFEGKPQIELVHADDIYVMP